MSLPEKATVRTIEQKVKRSNLSNDEIFIDRQIIEAKKCPICKCNFEYKAYSNAAEYVSFGFCRKCDYAEKIQLDRVIVKK